MKIKDNNNICSHQSKNFQNWFSDVEFEEKETKLYSKVLKESMSDERIFKELNPKEVSLGDMFSYLKTKADKKERMIFYVKDIDGVLRSVGVNWENDGWVVDAYFVEYPYEWSAVRRVFSASPFEISLPYTLSLEKAIEICKENGLTVAKTY